MVAPGTSRVPAALQQIFMQSQRGEDVEKIAPPPNLGFRIFLRGKARSNPLKKKKSIQAPTTSMLYQERGGKKETAAVASRKAIKARGDDGSLSTLSRESPHMFLMREMEERGYSNKTYSSLEGGYYCRPTPLQQASYGTAVNRAIRSSDAATLRKMLDAGISPNPCNNFGESLVHMVCRRGDYKLLRVLLEAGCSLQVTDDYGRTPLHDACWRGDPSFETVQLILDSDKHLVQLMDCRGTPPLAYVKPDNYAKWIEFLEAKLDRFWPKRDVATEGADRPPALAMRPPHSLPIPDPEHALPVEVAGMVANGQMDPEEAMFLDDESDDDSDYDSDDSEDYSDSDEDFDADEMREICFRAGGPMAVARRCFGGDVRVVGSMMKRA